MFATCVCRLFGCHSKVHDEEEVVQRWALYILLLILLILVAAVTMGVAAYATDQSDFGRWVVAIGYVIVVGHIAGHMFLCALRDCYMKLKFPDYSEDSRGVPPPFLGFIERLIFTIAIGVFASKGEGQGPILAAMGVWLGLKLISGWNRAPYPYTYGSKEEADNELHRQASGAMAALLTGVVNMALAVVAGLIASGDLNWPDILQFLTNAAGGGR